MTINSNIMSTISNIIPIILSVCVAILGIAFIALIISILTYSPEKDMKKSIQRSIDVEEEILRKNEEKLRKINRIKAELDSEGLEIKAQAIKKGLNKE